MSKEGQIKINTENLLPIIKKWLYSDKDIFIRELVANCCDAIKKLERLRGIGEAEASEQKPEIRIKLDKENRTVSISDNGIGMTEAEVEKYITQIAFSGAEEFIEKYKDKGDGEAGIIGHFGLGFYSAFMVSDRVEIETLSYLPDAKPVHWESDGSTTYEIGDGSRESVGTTVTLHINDDSSEFLESFAFSQILNKYCKFMAYEIFFDDGRDKSNDENEESAEAAEKSINSPSPLWLKAPRDCTDDEYIAFYHEAFDDFNEPLFWIHLNVDYPFNLKGILYFPKQNDKLKVMPGQVKLYCNQVYIADNIKEVIPEFLMLLNGVIDCPDLPLNVSRSFLQNDKDVAKISKHITKKVADKLVSIFNNDYDKYTSYWDDISPFIKFGCIKDEKFYDKIKDILLFKTINGEILTLEKLPKYDDKVFYVTDENVQSQYIAMCKENDINAVILTHSIDNHFISFLEYKQSDTKFTRVDSDLSSAMKTAEKDENESNDELIAIFKDALGMESLNIEAEHLKSKDTPAVILLPEFERRMEDMNKLYGGMFGAMANVSGKLVLNLENKVIASVKDMSEEKRTLVCKQIYDLALLSNRQLTSDELTEFIKRSVALLSDDI